MTQADRHWGATPVGVLADLGPVEAGLVIYLRLYNSGPEARQQAVQQLRRRLGVTLPEGALGEDRDAGRLGAEPLDRDLDGRTVDLPNQPPGSLEDGDRVQTQS